MKPLIDGLRLEIRSEHIFVVADLVVSTERYRLGTIACAAATRPEFFERFKSLMADVMRAELAHSSGLDASSILTAEVPAGGALDDLNRAIAEQLFAGCTCDGQIECDHCQQLRANCP